MAKFVEASSPRNYETKPRFRFVRQVGQAILALAMTGRIEEFRGFRGMFVR